MPFPKVPQNRPSLPVLPGRHQPRGTPSLPVAALRDQDATMRAVQVMNDPRVNEEQPADANAR